MTLFDIEKPSTLKPGGGGWFRVEN